MKKDYSHTKEKITSRINLRLIEETGLAQSISRLMNTEDELLGKINFEKVIDYN